MSLSPLKIVLCGDAKCGKTTNVRRWKGNYKSENYRPTLGVEVSTKANVTIWDCAGDKKFAGLLDGYLLGADLVIIVGVGEMAQRYSKCAQLLNLNQRYINTMPYDTTFESLCSL